MPSNSFNRQTARHALAAILTTALSTEAQAVFAYKPKSLSALGKGPFITLQALTADRAKSKYAGTYDNRFVIALTTYVLWLDADSGWTEQDSADRRDLLEKKIADALLDHRSTAQDPTVPWDLLEPLGSSELGLFTEGGQHWWTETLRVQVTKLNG